LDDGIEQGKGKDEREIEQRDEEESTRSRSGLLAGEAQGIDRITEARDEGSDGKD